MAYFPDLSPYAYVHYGRPNVVHVGWLDGAHPFPKGRVAVDVIAKLRLLAEKPVRLSRGWHFCEVCVTPDDVVVSYLPNAGKQIDPKCSWVKWANQRRGNGEIAVTYEETVFAAPVLILHYIEEHGYLPPAEFLTAVENTDIP